MKKDEEFYLLIVNHEKKIFMIVPPPIYNGSYYDNIIKDMQNANVNSSGVLIQDFEESVSNWKIKGFKHVSKEFFLKNSYSS